MTKLEQLQKELADLRKTRQKVILEKGEAAEDNKDLRENGAYIALEEREHYYTSKIHKVIRDLDNLTRKPAKEIRKNVEKKEKKYEFKPHKWL